MGPISITVVHQLVLWNAAPILTPVVFQSVCHELQTTTLQEFIPVSSAKIFHKRMKNSLQRVCLFYFWRIRTTWHPRKVWSVIHSVFTRTWVSTFSFHLSLIQGFLQLLSLFFFYLCWFNDLALFMDLRCMLWL